VIEYCTFVVTRWKFVHHWCWNKVR